MFRVYLDTLANEKTYNYYFSPYNEFNPYYPYNAYNYGYREQEGFSITSLLEDIKSMLISTNKFIVFNGKETISEEQKIKDINMFRPDIYVLICTNIKDEKGPSVITKANSEMSNGFAKSIYNKLHEIYYDKNVDLGVVYDENAPVINKINSNGVIVQIGNIKDIGDKKWIEERKINIAGKIVEGIIKGCSLKPC